MSSYKTRNPELIVPNAYADIVSGVEWLQENLAFSNEYVPELIEARQELFTRWKRGEQTLNSSQEQKLENFWDAMNRLLSFFGFRRDLIMRVLEFKTEAQIHRTRSTPPWLGSSLRDYMLEHGDTGVMEVKLWVVCLGSANSP